MRVVRCAVTAAVVVAGVLGASPTHACEALLGEWTLEVPREPDERAPVRINVTRAGVLADGVMFEAGACDPRMPGGMLLRTASPLAIMEGDPRRLEWPDQHGHRRVYIRAAR